MTASTSEQTESTAAAIPVRMLGLAGHGLLPAVPAGLAFPADRSEAERRLN